MEGSEDHHHQHSEAEYGVRRSAPWVDSADLPNLLMMTTSHGRPSPRQSIRPPFSARLSADAAVTVEDFGTLAEVSAPSGEENMDDVSTRELAPLGFSSFLLRPRGGGTPLLAMTIERGQSSGCCDFKVRALGETKEAVASTAAGAWARACPRDLRNLCGLKAFGLLEGPSLEGLAGQAAILTACGELAGEFQGFGWWSRLLVGMAAARGAETPKRKGKGKKRHKGITDRRPESRLKLRSLKKLIRTHTLGTWRGSTQDG